MSKMTEWRHGLVRSRGSRRINEAVDAGTITIHAAFRASRYLSRPEQDAALDAMTSRDSFSQTMAQVAREKEGRLIRADLTDEEYALVKDRRRQRGEHNEPET